MYSQQEIIFKTMLLFFLDTIDMATERKLRNAGEIDINRV